MSPSKNSFFAVWACAAEAKPRAATDNAMAESVTVFIWGRPFRPTRRRLLGCVYRQPFGWHGFAPLFRHMIAGSWLLRKGGERPLRPRSILSRRRPATLQIHSCAVYILLIR